MTTAPGGAGKARLLSIDGILHARSQPPKATTRDRGWGGVILDLHPARSDVAEAFPGLDHHLVNFWNSGRARLIQKRAGLTHDTMIAPGVSFVMPAGHDSAWEGDAAASARFRVPTALVDLAAGQIGRHSVSGVEIRNIFSVRDPVFERLSTLLIAETNQKPHPAQALIWESVSTALIAHLVQHYSGNGTVLPYELPLLGSVELARLRAYVEDNLDRSIGLGELATLVRVSRFHFARLFKRSTGMTAISFVEGCRVRRAGQLITDTDMPLAEVALATGFYDQSHFTRRFQVHLGCTPATYARETGRRRSSRR